MPSTIQKFPFALCVALLVAASRSVAAQNGTTTPVVLTGTVVEDVSRAPIQGANVRLFDDEGTQRAIATTDQQGRFRLSIPKPGTYHVGADRIGFRRGERVALNAGASAPAPVALTLTRNPVFLDSMITAATREETPVQTEQLIVGHLRDDDTGRPVEGGMIELVDGKHVAASKVSDQAGRFRMISPYPGRFSLRVKRPGYQPAHQDSIELRLGDTIVVDFRISRRAALLAPMTVTASAKPIVNRHDSWAKDEMYARMRYYSPKTHPYTTLYIPRDTLAKYAELGFTLRRTLDKVIKRAPMGCPYTLYVDGLHPGLGNPVGLYEPDDIDFIEVYIAPNIPGEWRGPPAKKGGVGTCMVLNFWLRESWRTRKDKK